jgi:hypothetical protein
LDLVLKRAEERVDEATRHKLFHPLGHLKSFEFPFALEFGKVWRPSSLGSYTTAAEFVQEVENEDSYLYDLRIFE